MNSIFVVQLTFVVTLNRIIDVVTKMNKDDAIIIIRSLLSSISSSCSISDLNKAFKKETGVNIPLFGYNNISDFLLSIPHVVKLTGIYPIERVSLVANEKSAHIVSLVKRQRCGKQQKKKISSNKNPPRKARIIARCPEFQESQKVKKNRNHYNNKDNDKTLKKEDNSLMSFREVSIKSCWCTHEEVLLINLKLHALVGEYVEVCPCEIFSPDKFFFHLRKFKKKFGCFMNDLQTFYATHEEIPTIHYSLIRPKQICAVFHEINCETKWYRAEIQEVIDDFRVIVNLIDFGSRAEILKGDLKFLHENFISLSRQACLGALANIRPIKSAKEWSSLAVRRFRDLAFKKDLVAGIVLMDAQTGCTSVALSMTKGKEIHINDTLVKEGYAEFEKNVLDSQIVDKSKEDNGWTKSKFNIDKIKHLIEKEYFRKKNSEGSSGSVPSENHISSGIHHLPLYASNVYSNNFRLKKMFSIV